MTHTLHRYGTSEELNNDWVVLMIYSTGINSKGSGPKMRKFADLCIKNNAVSLGSTKTCEYLEGGREAFLDTIDVKGDTTMAVQGTFNTPEDVANLLKDLKEADLGISVVVSGLTDKVSHMCKSIGTRHHTVTNSLGVWGRTDKLPANPDVLSIITMCGHSMISEKHICDLVDKIKKGQTTARKASMELASDCVCGILNPDRCEKLLNAIVAVDDK